MYTSSSTIEVNPPNARTVLMPDQVWEGMLAKARNPVGIVPGATNPEIVEEYPDGFLRRMAVHGQVIRERITISPSVQVLYTRVASPGDEGFIANTLSDLDGRPMLTFAVAVSVSGAAAGSAEEQEGGLKLTQDYRSAMRTVLDRARKAAVPRRD